MALDAVLVTVSLAVAARLRPFLNQFSFAQFLPPETLMPPPLFILFPALWLAVLMLFSIYDGRRNLRFAAEWASLTLGSLLAAVACAGALYLSFRDVSRLLFLLFVALAYSSLLGWRLVVRSLWRGHPASRRRVVIAGAGELGQKVEQQFSAHPEFGLVFVGYLDDERDDDAVIGYLADARSRVASHSVDDVVVALPGQAYPRVNQLVAELHDLPVRVWVIPDYFSLTLHRASVEEFAGLPMLDLRAPALSDYQRMVKRVFDILFSLILLPPALLVMGLAALAVRLDSPGPVFLRQKRVGEFGRMFEMVKFRSMVANAESLRSQVEQFDEEGHILHKHLDDPRVTRVGRFLRRASLDELPQIFNVLRGEMSWVGPRPELPYLVEKYEPWQRKRFAVPQGITGWWQINGRSDKPMHLHTEDDLYYVQNYWLGLDVFILLKTFWVVLRGKGAY